MDTPPTSHPPIPTLLTIEASWLGPPITTIPVRKPPNTSLRTVSNPSIIKKLHKYVQEPYALVDSSNRLIYFLGANKCGEEQRIYDILSLHKSSSPATIDPEEYTVDYIPLLSARYDSYLELKRSERPPPRQPHAYDLHMKELEAESRIYVAGEVCSYMNRYLCVIRSADTFYIEKRIDIERSTHTTCSILVSRLQLRTEKSLISAYRNAQMPGDQRGKSVIAFWLSCQSRKEY